MLSSAAVEESRSRGVEESRRGEQSDGEQASSYMIQRPKTKDQKPETTHEESA
jgi:hypothetical protein